LTIDICPPFRFWAKTAFLLFWHESCLYDDGACEILEILRQSACKICDWSYVKAGLSNQSFTITDDRIFIEKLANFSIKANAASRAVPVFEKHNGACPTLSYCFLGFASTFYEIR
jgi:hypothetical protein